MMMMMIPTFGARAICEGSPMERQVVRIVVRLGWDERTDRACKPLDRSPVAPRSLSSLRKSATHDGLGGNFFGCCVQVYLV